MDLSALSDADFEDQVDKAGKPQQVDGLEKGVATLFGVKEPKKPKAIKDDKWEVLSQLSAGVTKDQVKEKLRAFKVELTKELGQQ